MVAAQHNNIVAARESISRTDGVGVSMHRPGRLERLFAILSCRSRCSIGNSVHFHADHVEDVSVLLLLCIVIAMIDNLSSPHTKYLLLFYIHKIPQSVHVMIKHDREACKKRGQVSVRCMSHVFFWNILQCSM